MVPLLGILFAIRYWVLLIVIADIVSQRREDIHSDASLRSVRIGHCEGGNQTTSLILYSSQEVVNLLEIPLSSFEAQIRATVKEFLSGTLVEPEVLIVEKCSEHVDNQSSHVDSISPV